MFLYTYPKTYHGLHFHMDLVRLYFLTSSTRQEIFPITYEMFSDINVS